MSSDWWANQIGTAATATTPPGGVPQYGLAATIGTSQGWTPDSFNTWAADQTQKTNAAATAQAQLQQYRDGLVSRYGGQTIMGITAQQAANQTSFKTGLEAIGHGIEGVFGALHGDTRKSSEDLFNAGRQDFEKQGIDWDTFKQFTPDSQEFLLGQIRTGQLEQTPGISTALKGINLAYNAVTNPLEWPLQENRQVVQGGNFNLWFDPTSWGKAWRAAEDSSPAESLVDGTLLAGKSQADLDRIRRTNNLYQMATFAGDFAASMYLDPGVLAGKGLGTFNSVRLHEMPLVGSKGASSALEVLQAEDPATVAAHGGIRSRLGNLRGKDIAKQLNDPVRDYIQSHDIVDVQNLPMFRRKSTNGGALAFAFKYAADDDGLWDLTRRASFGDAQAWETIRGLKIGDQEILGEFGGKDPATYIDAMKAAETNETRLQNEIGDLTKQIDDRSQTPNGEISNIGMFRHYSWELDRSLADKQADLADLQGRLSRYQDYKAWLDNVPAADLDKGVVNYGSLNSASTRRLGDGVAGGILGARRLDFLNSHSYKQGPYGVAHTIQATSKAGWVKQANAIDLSRTDTGVESIMRQFEQLHEQVGYVNRDGLVDALNKYGHAANEFERFHAARSIEDEHVPVALANYFGLEPKTVREFMGHIRDRKDKMVNAILGGEGSLYSTAPDMASAQGVQLLERKNGYVKMSVADGDTFRQYVVPEDALHEQGLPVDVTQTPNYYTPLNLREIKLSIRHNHSLFEELESARKNKLRHANGMLMDGVDSFGTKFNSFWKPMQLFRLGWPMRMIMDEGLRGLTQLSIGPWFREYGQAFRTASLNAFNPRLHGPASWGSEKRAFLKAGPGPYTDAMSGKDYDIATHDAELDAAPFVPERFYSRPNRQRGNDLDGVIQGNTADWRARNLHKSGVTSGPEPQFQQAWAKHYKRNKQVVFDPINGNKLANGWAVPIKSVDLSTPDNMAYLIEQNRDILAAPGHRVMIDPASGKAHIVRIFNTSDHEAAHDYMQFADADHLFKVAKGTFDKRELLGPVDDISRLAEAAAKQEEELGLSKLDPAAWDAPAAAKYRGALRRREYGKGTMRMRGGDGKMYTVRKAFADAGEHFIALVSSSPAYAKITDQYKRTLSMFRQQAVGYKRLKPADVSPEALASRGGYRKAKEYYTYWADMLNNQVRNSPMWHKMLQGQSDEEVLHWLISTPEGAKAREAMPHKGQSPEYWVDEHRQALDYYLPSKTMQQELAAGEVTPTRLRVVPDELRPDVAAESLELINGDGIGALFGNVARKVSHALGSTPTDLLNRQPFFNGMYNLKIKNLIRAHQGELTEAHALGYERAAREFALRQVKRTMFDLMDDTNMTQALRFLSPFWGAQQEALEKWFRMFVQRPEVVARFYAGINQVYQHMTIINQEGNPVDHPNGALGYNPNDRMVIQIPHNLKKIAPFDKMLKYFGSVDFSLGSLNTAIQGENPFLPSLGPLVVIPANVGADMMWKTHATQFDHNFFYQWLFPVGRPNGNLLEQLGDQTLPGWAKRAASWAQGDGNRSYASTYWSIYREMAYANSKKGLPAPTPSEVEDATHWMMGLRTVAALGLPVQLNFRPDHQYFLDAYHKIQQQVGPGDADEVFIKKYGVDAARFAAAQSSSVGVPATDKGMAEWSKARSVIAAHPFWASAIISPDAWADNFSTDAYGQQFNISLGPGTGKTLRSSVSPEDRQKASDVQVGWLQYRQFMSAIDAELSARGMTSLNQSGAEDLAQAKAQFMQYMGDPKSSGYNDAWIRDYNTQDDTINQRVTELAKIAVNPMFDNRPDFQGVRQYLVIRQQATDMLEAQRANGGSDNMTAQDNSNIANWFYSNVGSLIQSNPSFGEFYTRWLSQDRLERGSRP